jgi:hypothetical protein
MDTEMNLYSRTDKSRYRKAFDPEEVDLIQEDEEEMIINPYR